LVFDVGALCEDIARSLGIVSKPVEESPGVWDCGKMRLSPGRYGGVQFVLVGEDPKGLLAVTSLRFAGSALIVPSVVIVEQTDMAVIEARGCRVFGLAENCRVVGDQVVVDDAQCWVDVLANVGVVGGQGGDITNKDVVAHMDRRFDTLGHEYSDLQRENVELKQNLAQVLANIGKKVDPEFLQWIFVILGCGSVNGAARRLGISGSTFDQRLKAYVERGGLYRTLYLTLGVRRKGVGQKSIVRFNELLKAHQQGVTDVDDSFWRELLDGLEALNGKNWQTVRDELIVIVKGAMTEG